MKRIKSFFKMKYEMFLMRLFDRIYELLRKTRSDWYPRYVVYEREDVDKWFDKWVDAERRADSYEIQLIRKDEYIYHLEERLDFYESKEAESES